jgi:uncharacterized protein DUF4376
MLPGYSARGVSMSDSFYYNAYYWYWLADDGRVFSSERQVIVDENDSNYIAWKANNTATQWPRDDAGNQTNDALQQVLAPYGTLFVDLIFYTADARWRKQTGGITVAGNAYLTDRVSENERNAAYNYVQANPGTVIDWKLPNGSFVSLDEAALTHVALTEGGFVQSCFTCEKDTVASITGGTITDRAGVDAAFAAVSNVFA